MKKLLLALPLAAALFACGCTPVSDSAALSPGASPEAATPFPTKTSEDAPPAGLTDAGLGRSDEADNWILVNYEGQFGWACTDYMS